VARRLRRLAGPGEAVARLGGDEFALVVPGLTGVRRARAHADRVVGALAEPVHLDGLPLDVTGAVGVAVYPEHGGDFPTLLRHAEIAMYDAKRRDDAVAVYAPRSDHNTPERLALLADLRTALAGEAPGIALYYQPQVDMASGAVVGLEALLRWRHPDRGLVDPAELIRVAEQTAVMRLLTLRVLDEVCGQLARWGSRADGLRVAVNVSVRDLYGPQLPDWIADRVPGYGLRPDQLQLEITEGALMADPHRVLVTLARLRQLGVSIALDDFGTGYSSMVHLRRLPLSEVKIDRSFVLGAGSDADDAVIVRSMIELTAALGLRVVAEGVEDDRTWRMLTAAGCHVAQGWFCARPMPADELMPWLRRYRAPTSLPSPRRR
jgi:predicted signal transduction protein with EAL and GGDEF domain